MNAQPYAKDRARRREANPFEMILIPILVVAGIAYSVIALNTNDFFWAVPIEFTDRPERIELYYEGERVVLTPGDPTYEALTTELNQQVSQTVGYYEHGLRSSLVEDAFERHLTVLFVYDKELTLKSQWNLGTPNQIFVPITGPNSRKNRVYTGQNELFGHGALIVKDLSRFNELVRGAVGGTD